MGVLRTLPSSSRMFSKAFLCSLDLEKEVGLMGSLASLPPCLSLFTILHQGLLSRISLWLPERQGSRECFP